MILIFLLSCLQEETKEQSKEGVVAQGTTTSPQGYNPPKHPQHPQQGHMKHAKGAQPNMMGEGASGGALQDPSGFPNFHDWPAPKGPKISQLGNWKAVKKLTGPPYGGYRPQITHSSDGELHVIYYDRRDEQKMSREV